MITWFLDTAHKYNLKVMLDVHAVVGSQNGKASSGMTNRVTWTDSSHFMSSNQQYGEWMGAWDPVHNEYKHIDEDRVVWAIDTVRGIIDQWGTHPALVALEPVSAPWF